MRLQSAIFTLGDTLFTPDGAAREGLDKALSLFKMEGVWLGAVTALSGTMFERAMKRLHSQKDDTIVFSGSLAAIQNAKDAGFRTVAVQGSAGAADWSTMQQLATQSLAQYSELLACRISTRLPSSFRSLL